MDGLRLKQNSAGGWSFVKTFFNKSDERHACLGVGFVGHLMGRDVLNVLDHAGEGLI